MNAIKSLGRRLINVVIFVVTLGICFGLAEAFAYYWETIQSRSPITIRDSSYYLSKLLEHKYPKILRDYNSQPCHLRYRDYYYVSFSCSSETLNTTSYYDARRAPDSIPLGQTDNIIWFFGGSTMINLTASDDLTIVNQVAKGLKERGIAATTINFGMGYFSSTQEAIKFIDLVRRVSPAERPKIAIFYDGYNDSATIRTSGAGNMPEDFAVRFNFLIEHPEKLWLSNLSNTIAPYSMFWRKFGVPAVQKWYRSSTWALRPPAPNDVSEAVEAYFRNVEIIRGAAQPFKIKTLFVIQPMIFTKTPLTDFEKEVLREVVYTYNKPITDMMEAWFQVVRERVRGQDGFLDLTGVLNGRAEDDFIDHGHTGAETGIVTGAALTRVLAPLLSPQLHDKAP